MPLTPFLFGVMLTLNIPFYTLGSLFLGLLLDLSFFFWSILFCNLLFDVSFLPVEDPHFPQVFSLFGCALPPVFVRRLAKGGENGLMP